MKARACSMLFFATLCLSTGCEAPAPKEDEGLSGRTEPSSETLITVSTSEMGELGRLLEEVSSGKPTDMDNDGFPETRLTVDEDGAIHYESLTPEGNVQFYSVKYPDGSSHTLSDINGDGNTDYQEDVFVDAEELRILQRIKQYDRNFDGYPEERKTIEFDRENQLMIVTEERDDEGSGNYIVVDRWTRFMPNIDDARREYRKKKKRGAPRPPRTTMTFV